MILRASGLAALSLLIIASSCDDPEALPGRGIDTSSADAGVSAGSGGSGDSNTANDGGSAGQTDGTSMAGSGAAAGNSAGGDSSLGGGSMGGSSAAAGSGALANAEVADAGNTGLDAGANATIVSAELDDGSMTFFVTSRGMGEGGDLGGLVGADEFCTQLAVDASADFSVRSWHAYLSTNTVDARTRIGSGPWRNQAGAIIANDLTQLHDQGDTGSLNADWPIGSTAIALDELGIALANGVHDVLTGSLPDGTRDIAANNCEEWTSNVADTNISAGVGHSNRTGGGRPPSWNSTHAVGCSESGTPNITQGGGRGSLYCFSVING